MKLLQSGLEHYSSIKKCKMTSYSTGLKNREEAFAALQTLELYVMDVSFKLRLEKELLLEPREKGYDVLLIEPYYGHSH